MNAIEITAVAAQNIESISPQYESLEISATRSLALARSLLNTYLSAGDSPEAIELGRSLVGELEESAKGLVNLGCLLPLEDQQR